jgi:hypothetical protein
MRPFKKTIFSIVENEKDKDVKNVKMSKNGYLFFFLSLTNTHTHINLHIYAEVVIF